MPSTKSNSPITQFVNCKILRDHKLLREDLWVRDGKILDPQKLFFDEHGYADQRVDCKNQIIAPGFIDVQINGGFGWDFSQASGDVTTGVSEVSKKILEHGVTSFCPTLVTSAAEVYHQVLPQVEVRNGGKHGAGVLGLHLEGPFINKNKKGAHVREHIRTFQSGGLEDLLEVYGSLDNVTMVTLAPELDHGQAAVKALSQRGVTVSLGHSEADLAQAEEAVQGGASFITHLFNAMSPFRHRDPSIVGLLASDQVPKERTVYYGMIADGIHTHPAALKIAHRTHPDGLVLVTDAIAAMGLSEGRHRLGEQDIEIKGLQACVAGEDTLCGSIATMDMCVRHFQKATGCSEEVALEAASLHPARLLNLTNKGTLDFGADADLVLLDEKLHVKATYISGEEVWKK
ncbi:N-acetylglucosamine-6-phosphate deacetylase [Synchiropus picturatus]